MKTAVSKIILLSIVGFAFGALTNEPAEINSLNLFESASENIVNELTTEEDIGAEDIGNEEIDNELEFEQGNSTEENIEVELDEFNNVIQAQWDIDPPRIVKKSRGVRRGKVLEAINLNKAFKKAIVIAHNKARMITKPSASDMRKMTWDNELQKIATEYSRLCIYEHNPNPIHKRFDAVGENLFISMGLPYNKKLLEHAVRAWDGEKTVYDFNTMTCEPGKMCGHYTQVVWADSFKVGCGVTRCGNINVRGKIWKNAVLFACNYGPAGNYRDVHPFVTGPRCSKCDTGDKCKAKLCANGMRDRLFFNPKLAKWTKWSKWSPCSKTCGMGSMRRERKCSTFVPTDCKGYGSEVKFCMIKPSCGGRMPNMFTYEIFLNDGDKFRENSIHDILKGAKTTFMRG